MNKDELYLNYLANTVISEGQSRIQYLSFLITINIAVYAAIYYLIPNQLWLINGSKLFLLLLLIFVNAMFVVMYLREHNISRNRTDELLDYFKNGWEGSTGYAARYIEGCIETNMRGWTWICNKLLFSVFGSIPVSFLITAIFLASGLDILEGMREFVFFVCTFLLTVSFYLALSAAEYKWKKNDIYFK